MSPPPTLIVAPVLGSVIVRVAGFTTFTEIAPVPSEKPAGAVMSSSLLQAAKVINAVENIIKLFSFILFKFKLNNRLFNSYRIHLINIPRGGASILVSPCSGGFGNPYTPPRRIWKSDGTTERQPSLSPPFGGGFGRGRGFGVSLDLFFYNCSITLITCFRFSFASALPARAASSRVDFAF